LISALEDEDTMVKAAAVTSLRTVALPSDARAVEALSHTAMYDSEWQVRQRVADEAASGR